MTRSYKAARSRSSRRSAVMSATINGTRSSIWDFLIDSNQPTFSMSYAVIDSAIDHVLTSERLAAVEPLLGAWQATARSRRDHFAEERYR